MKVHNKFAVLFIWCAATMSRCRDNLVCSDHHPHLSKNRNVNPLKNIQWACINWLLVKITGAIRPYLYIHDAIRCVDTPAKFQCLGHSLHKIWRNNCFSVYTNTQTTSRNVMGLILNKTITQKISYYIIFKKKGANPQKYYLGMLWDFCLYLQLPISQFPLAICSP